MRPHKKSGIVELVMGLTIVALLCLLAVFAPVITAHDPYVTDADNWLRSPDEVHIFGTDRLGRDVFSRVLYGARVSLAVGILATFLSVTVGTILGGAAGYLGGIVDRLIMRFTDIVLVFPTLLLILTLVAIFEPALWLVILVIGGTGWPGVARLVRGEIMRLLEADFTASARLLGATHLRILFVHLLPNAFGPILVAATLCVPAAIMTEAGLGYFGLGIQPPVPTWGNMMRDAQLYLRHAWWYATFPGLFIFITVFAFQLTGEGLRKRYNPRAAKRRDARA
ncbi:ABC transporter permease [Dethiobacter alkaliphilus]|uniref:Binding-protein-dependent transport systems inner membrane component n=1 Tax=Dethiobacter alkaliphilus AHT 1 TaxID=555088 RepID=C0GIS5_DETAL|nr:ABC transporter permease [Dethiobacter alkaliphilus]EEG76739.1 binding-protein-dependent transport systems inner membrane component [Dethiobacter alkaliphilus AHT 1]